MPSGKPSCSISPNERTQGGDIPENKGNPSGKYAEKKAGRAGKKNYQRVVWSDDASTEQMEPGEALKNPNRKSGSRP